MTVSSRVGARPLRRLLAASMPIVSAMLLAYGAVIPWSVAAQAAPCRFVLGFASLRDLIGAAKVGDCLENERFNPANGNAEQRTTGGLLVWRKSDNWTAFTDGATTWLNGPNGLQTRPNSERFAWEKDPIEPAPAAAAPAQATPTLALNPSPSAPQASPSPAPSAAAPASTPAPAPTAALPSAAPTAAATPPPNLDPSLARRCSEVATILAAETGSTSAEGSASGARAQEASQQLCFRVASENGARGVDCFERASREALRLSQTPRTGTDTASRSVAALYQACINGR